MLNDTIKNLTAILVDENGNIVETITDGVKDGLVVVTNSVIEFIKIGLDIVFGDK